MSTRTRVYTREKQLVVDVEESTGEIFVHDVRNGGTRGSAVVRIRLARNGLSVSSGHRMILGAEQSGGPCILINNE